MCMITARTLLLSCPQRKTANRRGEECEDNGNGQDCRQVPLRQVQLVPSANQHHTFVVRFFFEYFIEGNSSTVDNDDSSSVLVL